MLTVLRFIKFSRGSVVPEILYDYTPAPQTNAAGFEVDPEFRWVAAMEELGQTVSHTFGFTSSVEGWLPLIEVAFKYECVARGKTEQQLGWED